MPVPSRTPQTPTPARSSRVPALAGAGLSSVGVLTLGLAGAPWPMVLGLALTSLLVVLVQSALQSLIPQESVHRLYWWRGYWSHRKTGHRGRESQPNTLPPPP